MKRVATPQAPASSRRVDPSFCRTAQLALVLLSIQLGSASAVGAVRFQGSAQVAATATDNQGIESDLLDQRYNFSLFQEFTPFISVRFDYSFLDLTTSFEQGPDLTRRTQRPMLELLYNSNRVSGRLAVFDQFIENTLEPDDLQRRSLAAFLGWQPLRGPDLAINYQEDRNVADVSVFGRDVESRRFDLTARYNRDFWSTSYTFEQLVLENRSNDLRSDQRRHQLQAGAFKSFLADRLSLGFSGWVSRLNRTSEVGEDAELADPVPAVEGLFVVDTTPELGELEPNRSLIDGDIETPATPRIDIGAANTFRNIGLDLGITRPVTRLEIAVDAVSGPQVVWRVYRSRDNLVWEAVPGVSSVFDEALLRYLLRFPETEDRFFKAVNISTNAAPVVLVTEVRALLDVDTVAAEDELESTLYRADVFARFQFSKRMNGQVGAGFSTDEDVSAGLVRRDFSEVHANARLSVELRRDLRLDLGYDYDDSENLTEPVLLRTVNRFNTALRWTPLPTVDAILAATHRDESESGESIQTVDSVRLGAVTELLPELRLVSDLDFSRLEDSFAGTDRDSYSWRETLEMQLLPNWTLSGGFTYSLFESAEGESLLRRTQYRLGTTWNATRYLTLVGSWWYGDDNGSTSLRQSYNLSYAPGPKLTLSATYQGLDSSGDIGTSTDSVNMSYRLFRRFIVFANLSRSRSDVLGGGSTEISSLRAGLRLSF